MRRMKKAVVFSVALVSFFSFLSITSFGTVEIAKKEKTACTTCHVKMGSKELNDVGKCYQKKKSLKACESEAKEGK
jgi:predicted  nucleic acid-binding Zn-ribbon protein